MGAPIGSFAACWPSSNCREGGQIVRLHWTDSNAIRLLQNGGDFFPRYAEAIDVARLSVHLGPPLLPH